MATLLKRPSLDIEQFINKGGSSSNDALPTATANTRTVTATVVSKSAKKRGRPKGSIKEDPPLRVEMRIPSKILEKIDEAVIGHPILTSRHAWLLQAIYEKVAKDFA